MEILALLALAALIAGVVLHRKPKNYRIRHIGPRITYAEPREEGLSLWGRKT